MPGPEAAENFPVASRLLPARHRADLMAVYRFARYVDDIGDEAPVAERAGLLDAVDRDLDAVYAGRAPALPVLRPLAATIARRAVPADPFRRLVAANRRDQVVTRYESFDDLRGYCRLSADPIGHVVLHLFGAAEPARLALSDKVCTALQVIEHCQDVGEDHRRGRVYLPKRDLDRFGCTEDDLTAARTPTRLRGVIALQATRAHRLLREGAAVTAGLPRWPRLAIAGYIAGGHATLAALRHGAYDVLGAHLAPRPTRLSAEWLATLTGYR